MAEGGGKQVSSMITELKGLFPAFRTRRSIAFAYGFMFAFIAFTAFVAFNPSSNSSSLWFTSIFSTPSSKTSNPSNGESHFSSVFSHFFPNNSSSTSPSPFNVSSSSSLSLHTNTTRSNNTTAPPLDKVEPFQTNSTTILKNNTAPLNKTTQTQTLNTNQTSTGTSTDQTGVKANQTISKPPISSELPTNQTKTSLSGGKTVTEKGVKSNYSASLSKKQSNGTVVKQGIEDLMETLMNCDLFDGEWVYDDSYPLYKPGSCSFIDEQFNCIRNGRPDRDYQKMKWKPKGCTLPRYFF